MKTQKNNWKKASRLLMVFAFTLLLAFTITPAAHAGEYIEGNPDAILEEGEVVEDDLFIGGNDVLVAGVVEGDLFAGGQNVIISGEVYGNVFAAGNAVTVSGQIDGALFIAGYALTLEDSATIGRNVYVGGFSLDAQPESFIGRSIYGGAYQMLLNGTVERDANSLSAGFNGERLRWLSKIEHRKDQGAEIRTQWLTTNRLDYKLSEDLRLLGEPDSNVNVYMPYWSTGMPSITILNPGYTVDEALVEGEVNITVTPIDTTVKVDTPKVNIDPSFFILQHLRRRAGEFIALLLVGALGLWLMKDTLMNAVTEVKQNAGMDTVWGLLVYVLYVPVVMVLFFVLLMVTILISLLTLGSLTGELIAVSSLSFAGILTLFGILTGLATKIVIGYLVGRWLLDKMSSLSYESYWHHFAALALGVFLYEVLRAIPLFGFFVMLVVVVIGTGALLVLIKNRFQKSEPTAPAEIEATPA